MGKMLFIEGNFPSFKNSKQMTKQGFLIMSKTVRNYLKEYEYQWKDEENKKIFLEMLHGLEKPYKIAIHFVRGTKHKYDWVNMVQGVQDLMVKHNWIEDDNTDIMYPSLLEIEGSYSSYSKETPGVYISVENSDIDEIRRI